MTSKIKVIAFMSAVLFLLIGLVIALSTSGGSTLRPIEQQSAAVTQQQPSSLMPPKAIETNTVTATPQANTLADPTVKGTRPVYAYQAPTAFSDQVVALSTQIEKAPTNLEGAHAQKWINETVEQLKIHTQSGELHPQVATLAHARVLQEVGHYSQTEILQQLPSIAAQYKELTPLKIVGYQ